MSKNLILRQKNNHVSNVIYEVVIDGEEGKEEEFLKIDITKAKKELKIDFIRREPYTLDMFEKFDGLMVEINELMDQSKIDIAHVSFSNLYWSNTNKEDTIKMKEIFLKHFQKPSIDKNTVNFVSRELIKDFSITSFVKLNYKGELSRKFKLIEMIDDILLKLKEKEPIVSLEEAEEGTGYGFNYYKIGVFFGVRERFQIAKLNKDKLTIDFKDQLEEMDIKDFNIEEIYKEFEKRIHSNFYENRTQNLFNPKYYHTIRFFRKNIQDTKLRDVLIEKVKEVIPNLELERLIVKTDENYRFRNKTMFINENHKLMWYSVGEYQFLINENIGTKTKVEYLGKDKEYAKEYCSSKYKALALEEIESNEKYLLEVIDIDNRMKKKKGVI